MISGQDSIITTIMHIAHLDQNIVEVRILNTSRGTMSGYFDDAQVLTKAINPYIQKNNIYITMNPPSSDLFSRAANRLIPYAKHTTSDRDIKSRDWLLVDIDPERPAGISATDEEKVAAWELVEDVEKFLVNDYDWSQPIVADSGNGFHLLFSIDLPNDDISRDLVKEVLLALDFLFSNCRAKVDVTTYNAARIVKLPGTIACKGDDTPERPHRQSKIIKKPEVQKPVPVEKLRAVAAMLPKTPPSNEAARGLDGKFDVDAYLTEHGVQVYSRSTWQGGTRWVLACCPWNPAHINHSAYVVQFPNGAVAAGCHHDSCRGGNWHSLRDKLEPGWSEQQKKKKSRSDSGDDPEVKETQAEVLIRLASVATLFHTPTGEGWATVPHKKHKENFKIRSGNFERWLTKIFYDETRKPPGAEAIKQAIGVIESKAIFEAEEKELFLRVAGHNHKFYYDTADPDRNIIEIGPQGFKIADNPPNIFRRTQSMNAQVIPAKNGDIRILARHVPTQGEDDEILFIVTTVASLVPGIAHPVVVMSGEKGAAKTTSMRMLRRVIDPAACELIALPKSLQDLAIVLSNHYVSSFDNLESLSPQQSDLLCMASTGGSFSARTLYTNDEETILAFKHCVGLNGINVVATRPDLLDRSVILNLERIPKYQRKEEREVWEAFEADLPSIMGGAFTVLSKAMNIFPEVKLTELPRMADYCRWGYAIAEAIGYGGQAFLDAYYCNIDRANESAISDDPVAAAVVAFMRERKEWEDYAARLLRQLEQMARKERINTMARRWPRAAHILTKRLNEVKSNLEEIGITFERTHDKGGTRIRLENAKVLSSSKSETAKASLEKAADDDIFNEFDDAG